MLRMRRKLGVASVLLMMVVSPSVAHAGSFTVSGTGGLWAPYSNRPDRIAAYAEGHVLTTRNVGGSFSTPAGAEGGWIFDAPPGASIGSFALQGPFLGNDGWQAAVMAAGQFPVENCPGSTCPGAYKYLNNTYPGNGAPAVIVRLRCGSTRGCPNSGWRGYANVYASSVTIVDWTTPGVRITGGPLVAGGWRRGTQTVSYDAGDNVGIKEMRAYLGDSPRASDPRACWYGSKTPCPNGGGALSVSTAGVPDGPHVLTVQAIDTAGNVANASQTVNVDNSAPSAPSGLTLDGGPGWRATNAFAVRWSNPPQSGSPVAAALYRLCPESNDADELRGCKTGSRSGTGLRGISDLKVPDQGAWTLRLWLRDAAGNNAPTSAVSVRGLRFDAMPPAVEFRRRDDSDPTRIRVAATDAVSGLAVRSLEIRRRGSDSWRSVPVVAEPGGFAGVVDDGELRRGKYDLRARAVDAAGNERSADTGPNGKPMRLTLPLRIRTRLAVGEMHRGRLQGRVVRRLVGTPHASFGERVTLHGRLTTPGANPIEGTDIEVWQRVAQPGAAWRRVGTARTSRTGRFTYRAGRGPSRMLRFRYPGTATVRSKTTVVDIRVHASSSMRVGPRRVLNGEYVTFRGRVRGKPFPSAGKLVELQVYNRRRWRTFAQPRADAITGRWAYQYRFEAIAGRVTFRFRARIRKESDFPFELGRSRQVRVVVRGM